VIHVSDLHFRYPGGTFSLRVPELVIEERERVAVIGPSGSGKTTLLNLIAGISTPLTGRVVTRGVDLTALGERDRRDFRAGHIGLVFQEFELLDYLDVLDNVLLPFRIAPGVHLDREARQRAVRVAERVGLADKLDRNVQQLSQGERQRVALCRALCTEPAVVLADEPTGNLDPANKGRVLELLLDSVAATGATLVAVTHDHDLLDSFDRVVDFKRFYSPEAEPVAAGENGRA